jgi:hypothetical protein
MRISNFLLWQAASPTAVHDRWPGPTSRGGLPRLGPRVQAASAVRPDRRPDQERRACRAGAPDRSPQNLVLRIVSALAPGRLLFCSARRWRRGSSAPWGGGWPTSSTHRLQEARPGARGGILATRRSRSAGALARAYAAGVVSSGALVMLRLRQLPAARAAARGAAAGSFLSPAALLRLLLPPVRAAPMKDGLGVSCWRWGDLVQRHRRLRAVAPSAAQALPRRLAREDLGGAGRRDAGLGGRGVRVKALLLPSLSPLACWPSPFRARCWAGGRSLESMLKRSYQVRTRQDHPGPRGPARPGRRAPVQPAVRLALRVLVGQLAVVPFVRSSRAD